MASSLDNYMDIEVLVNMGFCKERVYVTFCLLHNPDYTLITLTYWKYFLY